MRLARVVLVWFLVYAMVVLPAAARTGEPSANPSVRLKASATARVSDEAVANPKCEAAVEQAAGSLARCLSYAKPRSKSRLGGLWGQETTSGESPLGSCGRRFERRIKHANQSLDRCTEVNPGVIEEEVYFYNQQSAQIAQGAGAQVTYYAFDAEAVDLTRYGDAPASSDSEPADAALSLSGIDTSNLLKIKERPERGTTPITWDGFLEDWGSHGVAQPIHVVIAGAADNTEGGKNHCMVEMKFSDPPSQAGASAATWNGSLLEASEACPDTAGFELGQASVIMGPVVIGEPDDDLPERFSREFQRASGKRAQCHLKAQARAAETGNEVRLLRTKNRCERNFEKRVNRAARKNSVGDFLSEYQDRLALNIEHLATAVTDAAQGTRAGEWNYGVGAGLATLSESSMLALTFLDPTGLTSYKSDSDRSHETLTWSVFLERWNRHADAFAAEPPTAILGGNYVDGSGDTHHCTFSLELIGAPQVGNEDVTWPVNVVEQSGICPGAVSLEDAFLFANARTAHSQQVAGLYSSESASEKSPYPVEGRKGVYTARVTATIPPYCHDCTDCAYHDNSKKKQVQVYISNFTDEKMALQTHRYARGVSQVDSHPIGSVDPRTRSRFAYNYLNNEEGDCKGNVRSVGWIGNSYFEYKIGDTPFAINLNSAQPNPTPNRSFWEEVKSWWDDKPLWEKIVFAVLAVFFIASVVVSDGATAEVAELGADLELSIEEDGWVTLFGEQIPEDEAVFNPAEIADVVLDDLETEDYFQVLDELEYYVDGELVDPITADDVLLDSGDPAEIGELADLDVSAIENFEAEDEVANLEAQNATMSRSGFARSILWTRNNGAAALVTEGMLLGNSLETHYQSSHQTIGAGFPKVDVRPDQSAHYFQQANVNGKQKTTKVLLSDNTQYAVELDGKYIVSVQSGLSEFRGFTANRYMPETESMNVLAVTVFPASSGDGSDNQDGLAKLYRMTAAGYVPKPTEECPKDCGLAIDRAGIVREIYSPSDDAPWEVSEVLELGASLSAYSVTPTDSAPERVYIGLSDGSLSELQIAENGDVKNVNLGAPGDAAPVLIRPHDSTSGHMYVAFSDGTIMANSSPNSLPNGLWHELSSWDDSNPIQHMGNVVRGPQASACNEPDPQAPADCYWLDWGGDSGCWKPSPTTYSTQSACVDANRNCNSGGGCFEWVSDPAGYFGTSRALTVTTANGTIYEGVSRNSSTGDYSSFSKLRSGDGGEGLESAIFADNYMFSFFSNQESHGCHCKDFWKWSVCPDTCRSSHFNIEATPLDDVSAGACSLVKQKIVSTNSKPKVGAHGDYFFVATEDDGEYDIKRFAPYAPCDGPKEAYAEEFEVLESEPVTTMSSTPKGLWFGLKNGSILHYDSDHGMKLLASSPATGNGCSEPGAEGSGCYWLSNVTGCWEASEAYFQSSEEACNDLDRCDAGGACYSYADSWSDYGVESITPGPNDLSAIVSVKRPGLAAQKRILTCQAGHNDCSWRR